MADDEQTDLAKRAEELEAEAERLRQAANAERSGESDADRKLSDSIEKLRRIANE